VTAHAKSDDPKDPEKEVFMGKEWTSSKHQWNREVIGYRFLGVDELIFTLIFLGQIGGLPRMLNRALSQITV
jgi:hypothetical protein